MVPQIDVGFERAAANSFAVRDHPIGLVIIPFLRIESVCAEDLAVKCHECVSITQQAGSSEQDLGFADVWSRKEAVSHAGSGIEALRALRKKHEGRDGPSSSVDAQLRFNPISLLCSFAFQRGSMINTSLSVQTFPATSRIVTW